MITSRGREHFDEFSMMLSHSILLRLVKVMEHSINSALKIWLLLCLIFICANLSWTLVILFHYCSFAPIRLSNKMLFCCETVLCFATIYLDIARCAALWEQLSISQKNNIINMLSNSRRLQYRSCIHVSLLLHQVSLQIAFLAARYTLIKNLLSCNVTNIAFR